MRDYEYERDHRKGLLHCRTSAVPYGGYINEDRVSRSESDSLFKEASTVTPFGELHASAWLNLYYPEGWTY